MTTFLHKPLITHQKHLILTQDKFFKFIKLKMLGRSKIFKLQDLKNAGKSQ